MRLKPLLLATALAAVPLLPAEAGVYTLVSNDFSTNPFGPSNTLTNYNNGTNQWFGSRHGVGGPSGAAAWNNFPGVDGANGFVGFTPRDVSGISLITRLPSTIAYGSLNTLSIAMNNASITPAGVIQAAVHVLGGDWYLTNTSFTSNGAWNTLLFNLVGASVTQYTTDGGLPNTAVGPSLVLASNVVIDQVGVSVSGSGDNGTGVGGNVLRWDNFVLTAVPEPATMALLGAGLLGLGFTRRRRD